MTSPIERRRTALRRSEMSSPIQHLFKFGFLDGSHSLFDYGCGRGRRPEATVGDEGGGNGLGSRLSTGRRTTTCRHRQPGLRVECHRRWQREAGDAQIRLRAGPQRVGGQRHAGIPEQARAVRGVRRRRPDAAKHIPEVLRTGRVSRLRREDAQCERHPHCRWDLPGVPRHHGRAAIPSGSAAGTTGVGATEAGLRKRSRGITGAGASRANRRLLVESSRTRSARGARRVPRGAIAHPTGWFLAAGARVGWTVLQSPTNSKLLPLDGRRTFSSTSR